MKHSKHDETIDRAVLELRETTPQKRALARAEDAVRKPAGRTSARRLSIALRLAGATGTAAVLALAFGPRTGGGLAWAQVANKYGRETRVHELLEMRRSDGKGWMKYMDRWQDGDKYSLSFHSNGAFHMDMRFDGTRYYSFRYPLKTATVRTVNEKERSSILWLGKLGERNQSLDAFLGRGHLKVESQKNLTDPDLGEIVRYRIHSDAGTVDHPRKVQLYDVDVDPKTERIRRWQTFDQKGVVVQRGLLEFPPVIEDSQFQPPANPPAPLFDVDAVRPGVVANLQNGLATIGKGKNKAMIRGILVEEDRFVWIFWTGTPPNGRLDHPVKVLGPKVERAWGMPNFTTSRVAMSKKFDPASVLKEPLAGMCVILAKKAPDKVSLKIPLFEPAKTKPIKDKTGKVVGYESKFVGYQEVRDLPVTRVSTIWDFASELGIQQSVVSVPKGKVGIGIPVYKTSR